MRKQHKVKPRIENLLAIKAEGGVGQERSLDPGFLSLHPGRGHDNRAANGPGFINRGLSWLRLLTPWASPFFTVGDFAVLEAL